MDTPFLHSWSKNKGCILLKLENLYKSNVSITRFPSPHGRSSYGDCYCSYLKMCFFKISRQEGLIMHNLCVLCILISFSKYTYNGRRIYWGGGSPLNELFLFRASPFKKFFFAGVISGVFGFRWVEGGFCGTLQGVYIPPTINPELFFIHILTLESRLDTSYGLETWYVQLFRHVRIVRNVLRPIRHRIDGFMTS